MSKNVKLLLSLNLVLAVLVSGLWLRARLSAPQSQQAQLRQAYTQHGFMSGQEFDKYTSSVDGAIEVFAETVNTMPTSVVPDVKWQIKLATVLMQLSLEKRFTPSQRVLMASSARTLATKAEAVHDDGELELGLKWLGHCGSSSDSSFMALYLNDRNPKIRAAAEGALEKLTHANH